MKNNTCLVQTTISNYQSVCPFMAIVAVIPSAPKKSWRPYFFLFFIFFFKGKASLWIPYLYKPILFCYSNLGRQYPRHGYFLVTVKTIAAWNYKSIGVWKYSISYLCLTILSLMPIPYHKWNSIASFYIIFHQGFVTFVNKEENHTWYISWQCI